MVDLTRFASIASPNLPIYLHTYEPKQILAAKLFSFQIVSAQEPSEVTLKGNEYLSYNLFEKSGEAILSIQDEVSLFFRTNRPEGLLFYTGDPLSFPDKQ